MKEKNPKAVHARSQLGEIWFRFRQNKMAVLGMIILIETSNSWAQEILLPQPLEKL